MRAAPTWPTSVDSSVSRSGTRGDRSMAPSDSGSTLTSWAVAATSRSGRSWRRTSTEPMVAAAATPARASSTSSQIRLPIRSSTSSVGSPVTTTPSSVSTAATR